MKSIETNNSVVLGVVGAAIIVLSSMIYFVDIHIQNKVKKQVASELQLELQSSKKMLSDFIDLHRRQLLFLHETPPISGMSRAKLNGGVDPLDNTTFEQWIKRLETIFIAKLKNQHDIDQLRVLNAKGMEILRVDRLSGRIEAHPKFELQDKSQSQYFNKAQTLQRGQYYISSISLNREFDQIEYPFRPAMRLVAPIFNDDNSTFGYLVANVNPKNLISSLDVSDDNQTAISILNTERQVIWHVNEALQYAADLSPDIIWPAAQNAKGKADLPTALWQGQKFVQIENSVPIAIGKNKRQLVLVANKPESYVRALITEERFLTFSLLFVILVVASVIITTLMIQARNRLKYAKSQSIFSAIINGSQDVILSLDSNGKIISWNHAAAKMFELSDKQALGLSFSQILGKDKDDWVSKIRQVLKNGQTIHERVKLNLQGHELEFSMTVAPAKSSEVVDESKLLGVAVIMRDISEEIASQKAIEQANESLEKQVGERTAQLEVAHKEAVRASEVKSAFVSNISHEMRTPLNGIIGMINLVARENLSSKQQHYLQMAENSAETLATLVNDILDLSKIEAGKLDIERVQFDLLGLLENIVASMAVRAFDNSIELILDISNLRHKSVVGDPLRFNQILFNLVGNAIKFTESGHVIIQVSSYPLDQDKIELRCDVIDTGIGIAEENYHKIFSKFDQETSGTSQMFGGTGLGLSISRQLAELMGGEVSFVSEKGVGSTFTLKLPYAKASANTLTIESDLHGQNILCVSPSKPLNNVVFNLLQQMGANVINKEVADESTAALLCEQHFDWLLLDAAIPDLEKWYSKALNQNSFNGKVALFKSCIYQRLSSFDKDMLIIDKPVTLTDLQNKLLSRASDKKASLGNSRHLNGQVFEQFKELVDKLSGTKVLAVDDNDINLEVARGFLEPLDIRLTTASNGKEALTALKQADEESTPFSLVLMDCQMPIMDGYQAATAIRRGDAGENGKDIPIIAMTASAMAGEREKCIAAGMTDYVTKPISVTVITEKVVEYLGSQEAKYKEVEENLVEFHESSTPIATLGEVLQPEADPNEPIWDYEGVMARLMNDDKLYRRLITMFFEDLPDRMLDIDKAMEEKKSCSICATSHRLKGIAGDVGAMRLHKVSSQLELAAKDQDIEKCVSFYSALKKEVSSIKDSEQYMGWQESLSNS